MAKMSAPTFKGSELIRAATGLNRDVMNVVLDPDGRYTEAEAQKRIEAFLHREVDSHGGR